MRLLFKISILIAVCSTVLPLLRSYLYSKSYPTYYTPRPSPSYDYLIVGGGTAGSLIASQLASRHPNRTVLLLEAGSSGVRTQPLSEQSVPGAAPYNLGYRTIEWDSHRVEPQTAPLGGSGRPLAYDERRHPIPVGKGLGGSNELNFMLHVRGTDGDYGAWERSMRGAEREYEERIAFGSKAGDRRNGGDGGDGVSDAHPLAEDWVRASAESEHGKVQGSYNDPLVGRDGGFHYEHAVRNGVRQSTARQFLLPRIQPGDSKLDNLHVVLGANVEAILFEDAEDTAENTKRADGLAVYLDPCVVPSLSVPVLGTLIPELPCLFSQRDRELRTHGQRTRISATREIVLSAGAYGSPHLLLRSGVGPKDELEAAGVPTVVDLPGVGKNLMDHPIVPLKYRLGKEGGAWFPISAGKLSLALPSTAISYLFRGRGLLSSSGCDMGYFGTSSSSHSGTDRPDLQVHGMVTAGDNEFFLKMLRMIRETKDDVGSPSDYGPFAQGLAIAPTLLHPKTRGEVRLRPNDPHRPERIRAPGDNPSPNPVARYAPHPPIVDYQAFREEEDLSRLVEGVRRTQDIMSRPAMARHGPTLLHSRCGMGPADDPMAVVDPELRVRGVEGLRVADASVMPDITSGNTQVPTAAIGVQMVRILG